MTSPSLLLPGQDVQSLGSHTFATDELLTTRNSNFLSGFDRRLPQTGYFAFKSPPLPCPRLRIIHCDEPITDTVQLTLESYSFKFEEVLVAWSPYPVLAENIVAEDVEPNARFQMGFWQKQHRDYFLCKKHTKVCFYAFAFQVHTWRLIQTQSLYWLLHKQSFTEELRRFR